MKQKLALDNFTKQIEKDLEKISKKFQQELAQQALNDMEDAYQSIITQFYSGYSPTSYKRHKRSGFGNTLVNKQIIHNRNGATSAYIKGSPEGMKGKYRIDPSNIYDLIWNNGIRGLPEQGDKPLSHSYIWLGHQYNQGEIWHNPFWSGGDPYDNIFNPTLTQNGHATSSGTPREIMSQFVYNWDLFNGVKSCSRIANQIKQHGL